MAHTPSPLAEHSRRVGLFGRLALAVRAVAVLAVLWAGPALAADPAPRFADARPGEVRIFVTNALMSLFKELEPAIESATGRSVLIQYGGSYELPQFLASGEPFELAVVTGAAIDRGVGAGQIVPGSRVDIAKVAIEIGVKGRGPAQAPDSPERLRTLFTEASVFRRSISGMSYPIVEAMLQDLRVADAVKDKTVSGGDEEINPRIRPGSYGLIVTTASEMYLYPGVTILGTVPARYGGPVPLSAGLGPRGDAVAARAVIDFLRSPAIDSQLREHRLLR